MVMKTGLDRECMAGAWQESMSTLVCTLVVCMRHTYIFIHVIVKQKRNGSQRLTFMFSDECVLSSCIILHFCVIIIIYPD